MKFSRSIFGGFMRNVRFRNFFTFLVVFTISTFSLFAAGFSKPSNSKVTEAEWKAAFEKIDNASCKYTLGVVVDTIDLGNVNGVFKFVPNKLWANANLNLSATIDNVIESQFGDTISGAYNFYIGYDNKDYSVKTLKYTTKNSSAYIDASDKVEVTSAVSDIIKNFATSLKDGSNNNYSNFVYKDGKYIGSSKIDLNGNDANVDISYSFSKGNVASVDATVNADIDNPMTGAASNVVFTFSGYIYDYGKTKINL